MSHVSIRARLIFLSVLLLVILAVSSALLIRELMRHSQSLAEQARLVSIVRTATTASKHFGDLKYWLTDLAITQLTRSQENAAAAKARLDEDLKAMATVHSEGVTAIGREVETLTDLARRAGEAYSGDDSVEGNALLAQARSRILNIDDEIDKIVARVEQQALAGRDASARQADRVVKLSIIGGMVALAVKERWFRDKVAGWGWLVRNRTLVRQRRRATQSLRRVRDRDLAEHLTATFSPGMLPVPAPLRLANPLVRGYWRLVRRVL